MVSDTLILPWLERVRQEVPDVSLFDVHTHIGSNDPDGFSSTTDELVGALERAEARGVVFPMHEPDGYPRANDMVIAEAAKSDGRLVPFCRLDPRADPVGEAERSLAAGARASSSTRARRASPSTSRAWRSCSRWQPSGGCAC